MSSPTRKGGGYDEEYETNGYDPNKLILAGHSFVGESALLLASLVPDRDIDLLVTIDMACVRCASGLAKPPNVQHALELYRTENGSLGTSEDIALVRENLRRLTNADQHFDIANLFAGNARCLNELGGSVSHTEIDDSTCVHNMVPGAATLFTSEPTGTPVPEPSAGHLLGCGIISIGLYWITRSGINRFRLR